MTSSVLGRALAAGCAALALLLTVVPRPADAQEAPSTAAPTLAFKEASPYVAQAGGTYTIRFTMTDAPPDAMVWFRVGYSLTVDNHARDELDAIVAGKQQLQQLNAVSRPAAYFAFTQAGGPTYSAELTIAQGIPPPEFGFVLTDPGVYPLTVSLTDADGHDLAPSFTTFMIVLAPSTVNKTMALAPVLPFHAPVALQPNGSYELSDDSGRQLNAVRESLTNRGAAAVTLAATPETVDALGHVTSATAPSLDALAKATGSASVLASPYVDLDENAWAGADLTSELRGQLGLGSQVLDHAIANGHPLETGTWIADGRLTAAALDQLKSVGIDRLVVSEGVGGLDPKVFDGRRQPAEQFAEQQPFDIENDAGGRFRTITADSRLAARLTATSIPAYNAQLALADLALLYCGPTAATKCSNLPSMARAVALEVPQSALALSSFDVLLDLLAVKVDGLQTPMVRTETLRAVLDSEPATTNGEVVVRTYDMADPATVPSMDGYRDQLRHLSPMVSGYQSMVATTAVERGVAMRRALDVSGAAMPADQQQAYLTTVDHQLTAITDAIVAPTQEPSTLTSSDAAIQVRVENHLDYPVTVRLEASSDKLEFSDGRQRTTVDQVLAPNATTGIKVDVKARASGTFSLDTKITSPDGSLQLDEGSLEVRSTAVSQLGLVLTICAGFFLLAWWIKHFRATRRARKLVDPTDVDALQPTEAATREHEPA